MTKIKKIYFLFRNQFAKSFPQLYFWCDKHKTIVKCAFAGACAGFIDLLFVFIFVSLVHWRLLLSTSLAFMMSFLISFTLQKFWTFRNLSQNKAPLQLFLYLLNAFIGLNLNGFLMHSFVHHLHVWYLLAQLMVNLLIGAYNYFAYNFVIFKIGKNEDHHGQEAVGTGSGDLA